MRTEDDRPLIVFRRGRFRLTARGRKAAQAAEDARLAHEAAIAQREAERVAQREADQAEYWQHKDKQAEKNARRRARQRGAPVNNLTKDQWSAILQSWDHRCAYCGARGVELTKDHVLALAAGGNHTADNIVPACLTCNARKGRRPAPPFAIKPNKVAR